MGAALESDSLRSGPAGLCDPRGCTSPPELLPLSVWRMVRPPPVPVLHKCVRTDERKHMRTRGLLAGRHLMRESRTKRRALQRLGHPRHLGVQCSREGPHALAEQETMAQEATLCTGGNTVTPITLHEAHLVSLDSPFDWWVQGRGYNHFTVS